MNYQQILENIYQEIQPYAQVGKQADYIPALAKVNPDQFGICINTVQGETFMLGDATTRFSIQSISKVFLLAMCLSIEGDGLWRRAGKEPSGTAFNSLIQLEVEKGTPPQSVYQCRCHCADRHPAETFKTSQRRFPPFCPPPQRQQFYFLR